MAIKRLRSESGSTLLMVVVLGIVLMAVIIGLEYQIGQQRYDYTLIGGQKAGSDALTFAQEVINELISKQVIIGWKTAPSSPFPNKTYWLKNPGPARGGPLGGPPASLGWVGPWPPSSPAGLWSIVENYAQSIDLAQQATVTIYYCNAQQLPGTTISNIYATDAAPVTAGAACSMAAVGAPRPVWISPINIRFTDSDPATGLLYLTMASHVQLAQNDPASDVVVAGFGPSSWFSTPKSDLVFTRDIKLTVPLRSGPIPGRSEP